VVARHDRRSARHATDSCVCIDCGARYLATNAYKGNYCPDCHETWIARQTDESSPSPTSPRLRSSARQSTDAADEGADEATADEE
jgi:predicted RNA-binding Zn-ribbon protein involved in translation (DUF1610 family)